MKKNVFKLLTLVLSVAVISSLCVFTASARTDWWNTDPSTFEDFHGENLPHVVDNAGLFSSFEESRMSSMIESIINRTGYDFVIMTDDTTHGLSAQRYADDFYVYNGYGIDNQYSGIVLFIDMDPYDRQWLSEATGKVQSLLTRRVVNTIDDSIEYYMRSGNYAEAMYVYIEKIEELYTTGTVEGAGSSDGDSDWSTPIVFGIIVGLVVSLINLSRMKNKMKPVKTANLANDSIVKDSFVLRNKKVSFLYRNVTRVRIRTESSGSSYSGSHHSSSGRSFSGGGRHF